MDELIAYVNSNASLGATVRYSTFSEYAAAVFNSSLIWPVHTTDFFPYASSDEAYWTGYFTSRPLLKGYIQSRAAVMRTSEVLTTVVVGGASFRSRGIAPTPEEVIGMGGCTA